MASWLKAAEDLFEVVDRRAKLVVSELADEESESNLPASNGQGSQGTRSRLRTKTQKQLKAKEPLKLSNTARKQTNTGPSQVDLTSDNDRGAITVEDEGPSIGETQKNSEQQDDTTKDSPNVSSTEPLNNDVTKHNADQGEVPATVTDADTTVSTSNVESTNENALDVQLEHSSLQLPTKEIDIVNELPSNDDGQDMKSGDATNSDIDSERFQSSIVDPLVSAESPLKDGDAKVETPVNPKKQQEHKVDSSPKNRQEHKVNSSPKKQQENKADSSPKKVEDQLDEAQGLLKIAKTTGQSKEARMARVCAGLSSRLQEYKSENAQLEELLAAERELSKSCEARIKQLRQELSAAKGEVTRAESNMVDALAAKNSEIEALVNAMDALKRQAAVSEGNLASLQANMETIMRSRELTETRMMQALREELASAERRAEEERAAHNATKMAAMEREVELEHRAVESSTALARIQRIADERTAKCGELEQKLALLEVECASLNQELQDMEARVRRGQKKSPDEASQVIQMQAWQEEVERARQGQRDAESKLSALEAEVQKMRVEMAAMKRDAEHYSRQEHVELEKRYRELTDLLYYKQTQLESMASEKAAAEFQLEKEIKRLQEAQAEAERSRVSRRASTTWEEDTDMKTLEPLPLHHRQIAGATRQLQKAAKLLDSGAVRATRFLWRYPTARVILMFYLVFVHLFLMYLLHRLQEQADNFAAREVAESMGLATKLP